MPAAPPPRTQSAAGLDAVFAPRSVAVVGASPDPASVGHRVLASLQRNGFRGALHPVHPRAAEVLGLPVHRTVGDVPGPVDLAVVAVPAAAVLDVARQCAVKGVRALVVISAGFREAGPQGAAAEQELGALARAAGMRVVGPNCLGVVNADPAVRLHAIFSDTPATGGPIALMTQSGALGIALLERAHALGLGVGRFASMGNKLDVSGNDLLLHWESDPGVQVILMHLESVGNPRNFVRIASRVSRTKPIVLVKGGRTEAGARAAGSHTGAMMDADTLVDAMVRQAGVLRVATVEELFDATLALSLQPLPAGDRVAVVTNSGGPAILLADALPAAGLRLATLGAPTLAACARRLPPGAAVSNPLDMLAGADPPTLTACLADLLRDPGTDAVVALATPLAPDDLPWADAIVAARDQAPGKALVAVLFGRDPSSAGFRRLVAAGIPAYTFPENAAQALSALARVAAGRRRLPPTLPERTAGGAPRPARAGWLPQGEALAFFAALGAQVPGAQRCASPDEVAAAAARVGFPVAVKVEAPGLVHKTEAGAVRLDLRDAAEAERAARDAWQAVRGHGFAPAAVVVQAMAPAGVELLVGAVNDAKFGPAVSVGLGGVQAEALRDVATRLAPVSAEEAEAMIASLRCAPLLGAFRGEPARDVAALRDLVVRLADHVARHPEVAEAEANPVRVLAQGRGLVAVDARVRLAAEG